MWVEQFNPHRPIKNIMDKIQHIYKPCYYANKDINDYFKDLLCLCPDGHDRCHIKGCGKKKTDHIIENIGKDNNGQ